jgi:hypothetical protein
LTVDIDAEDKVSLDIQPLPEKKGKTKAEPEETAAG